MKLKKNVIREKRTLMGYSQEYLADFLEISQAKFSKLENGETQFKINELSKIIELLELNPLEIFDFSEKEQIFINSSNSGNINSTINNFDENHIRVLIREELARTK
jgi:transcriptional regulator with XRE-family HTH domain